MFVTDATDFHGHTYTNTNPRGIFIGIVFAFDVSFAIPDGGKPLHFHTDLFRPAALGTLKDENGSPALRGGKPTLEEKLYEVMAVEATDAFVAKLLAQFVTPPKK